MDTIADKIRKVRLSKGYSQEYIAYVLNMSQAAYSNIENGRTSLRVKHVYEIAEALEVSAFELLPKPKYGTAINLHHFQGTLMKFRKFFSRKIAMRQQLAKERGIV